MLSIADIHQQRRCLNSRSAISRSRFERIQTRQHGHPNRYQATVYLYILLGMPIGFVVLRACIPLHDSVAFLVDRVAPTSGELGLVVKQNESQDWLRPIIDDNK